MIDAVILLAATAMLVFFGLAAWRLAAGPAPRRRSLARRIALLSVVALFVVGAATYKISNSRTFQFGGHIVQRLETSSPRVALTFDDGPAPGATEEALAVLGRYGVQGTFFLVGSDVEANMAQAREIAAGGHEIGNHTYSHSRMIFVSPSTVRDEIERPTSSSARPGIGAISSFGRLSAKNYLCSPTTWPATPEQTLRSIWSPIQTAV